MSRRLRLILVLFILALLFNYAGVNSHRAAFSRARSRKRLSGENRHCEARLAGLTALPVDADQKADNRAAKY